MTLDGYPIDKDYIGVEKNRAEITTTEETEKPPLDRRPLDHSHVFGGGYHGLSRPEGDRRKRDEASYVSHDGRAHTRTTFWPNEAANSGPLRSDGKRISWSRLAKWNDGMHADDRATRSSYANQRRDVAIFCSQLELTSRQRQIVLEVTEELNMSHMATYSSEVVILSIISIVANVDGRWIRDEEVFRELVVALDTTLKDVRACRQLVMDKSENL